MEDDAGFVVPYLDVAAAAERIVTLAASPDLPRRLGQHAAEKARHRYDYDAMGRALVAVWEQYLGAADARPVDTARLAAASQALG